VARRIARRLAQRKDTPVAQYDTRFAVGERDSGVRKVSRLTWRTGLIGAAAAALLGVVFAHPAGASRLQTHNQPGGIIIPGQPPQPSSGGGQVTSGAS
jgi:hypothetical protein